MPELFSRMDNLNWLTPSVADILDQGSTPPGGDGSIRERMLTIQHELEELDTPARIVNVRSTPSYTLYIARPESVGRMENRRTVTTNEIKKSIKQLADNHSDWLLGYIPQLHEDDSAIGILLRTTDHRPMSLRRLLVRSNFRNHPSTLALVLGITLEQQIILHSLNEIGHMLIVGSDNAKQHLIRSTLLTLIMLNTPSELRVALAGQGSEIYKFLVGAPHALGRILTEPNEAQRLIDGLVKEIQRRQQSFKDEGVTNISDYNTTVNQEGKAELPRIVLVIDALSDEHWKDQQKQLSESLTQLLSHGAQAGIHLILTTEDEDTLQLPSTALEQISLKVVLRAYSKDLSSEIPDFHASLLRFIDAFVLDKNDKENPIIPIELSAISNTEIKNVVDYWRQMSKQRYQEMQMSQSSNKTGVTGVLRPPAELQNRTVPLPTPPKPPKPSVATLERATQVLETQVLESRKTPSKGMLVQTVATVTLPEQQTEVDEGDWTEEIPTIQDKIETVETPTNRLTLERQSIALAAYLGWLSVGALHDIFGMSNEEAQEMIDKLRADNIIEDIDGPTFRFMRLVQLNGRYPTD